jgi:hypothetical protein
MSKRRNQHEASEAEVAEEAVEAAEAEAEEAAAVAEEEAVAEVTPVIDLLKYPECVQELICVLKQSGTGKGKLDKLQAMITEGSDDYCKDLSGFLTRCHEPSVIPEGTKTKIDEFFAGRLPQPAPVVIEPIEGLSANAAIEAEGRRLAEEKSKAS